MAQPLTSTSDPAWLLDDLVDRVAEISQAVLLSADGLLTAASRGLSREDADHLSALASAFQSLARGAGRHFGAGAIRQTIIEMDTLFLFVTAAGEGANLAVLAREDCDVGLVAYEMAMLVTRVGKHLGTPARPGIGPDRA
jgi:predicted regulator of Ras-like GTPase activity (Roadblock/LC7/MglB family)